MGIEVVEAEIVESAPQERVFDDGVIDLVFPALRPERGILRHVNASVVHNDARGGVPDFLRERFHYRLFFRKDFCVGHSVFTSI